MILTSNTRLTDRIAEWLDRRPARYLAKPVKDFVPLATASPGAFFTRVAARRHGPGPTCRSMSGRFQVGANPRVNRMCWSRLPKVKARDGATTTAEKPTGVAKAALDDVKPCESIGIAPVPTAVEAARSKS
jgi:hypothetical protein